MTSVHLCLVMFRDKLLWHYWGVDTPYMPPACFTPAVQPADQRIPGDDSLTSCPAWLGFAPVHLERATVLATPPALACVCSSSCSDSPHWCTAACLFSCPLALLLATNEVFRSTQYGFPHCMVFVAWVTFLFRPGPALLRGDDGGRSSAPACC